MNVVVGHVEWREAGLLNDPEAMAWLHQFGADVLRFELVDQGVLAYHTHLKPRRDLRTSAVMCSSCTCQPRMFCPERDDWWVTVRRYWRGPVPAQVLAAFQPEATAS